VIKKNRKECSLRFFYCLSEGVTDAYAIDGVFGCAVGLVIAIAAQIADAIRVAFVAVADLAMEALAESIIGAYTVTLEEELPSVASGSV
jgi:hypothetical protein